jgi:hypothetical protein
MRIDDGIRTSTQPAHGGVVTAERPGHGSVSFDQALTSVTAGSEPAEAAPTERDITYMSRSEMRGVAKACSIRA